MYIPFIFPQQRKKRREVLQKMDQENKKHTAALMESDKRTYAAFTSADNAGAGSSSSTSDGLSNIPFDYKVVDYEHMSSEALIGNPFLEYDSLSLPNEVDGKNRFEAKEFESMFSDDLRFFLEENGLPPTVSSRSHGEDGSTPAEEGVGGDDDDFPRGFSNSDTENMEECCSKKDWLSKPYYKLVSEVNTANYMDEYERLISTFDYLVHLPPGSSIAIVGKCELVRGKNITVIEDTEDDLQVMRTDGSNVAYHRIRVTFAPTFIFRVNINNYCKRSRLVLLFFFCRPQDSLKFRNLD